MKPLAVDLCCGLGGWTDGLLAEGWDVIGFDIERHIYGGHRYPSQLVLQDIMTLTGKQFRGKVSLIVASPPCQKYSYMAMPWKRAKALQAWYRDDEHPERIIELNALFDACKRVGREAQCATIIENVRGAQSWVGRARWNWGSFYLWGDVPALMPPIASRVVHKGGIAHRPNGATNFHRELNNGVKAPGMNWSDQTKRGQDFTRIAGKHAGIKNSGGSWFNIGSPGQKVLGQNPVNRQGGIKCGGDWFNDSHPSILRLTSSGSPARKFASAMIAKIPLPLSRHIAAVYRPDQ